MINLECKFFLGEDNLIEILNVSWIICKLLAKLNRHYLNLDFYLELDLDLDLDLNSTQTERRHGLLWDPDIKIK